MQMTNSELAAHLNKTLSLADGNAITTNVVRQWVAWDVLPKAKAEGRKVGQGPVWSRSDASLRRATRLGELRRRGIRREKALIVHAYIEWGHRDFDRVREAFGSEWAKWSAQLNRRQTTFLENEAFSEISASKKRAIANQLGPLDHRLRGTQFEQLPELYTVFSEFSRTGDFEPNYVQTLLFAAFAQIVPDFAEGLPPSFVAQTGNSFLGMTGSPDEIEGSGLDAIRIATEREFRITRYLIRQFLRALESGKEIEKIGFASVEVRHLWQMLQLLRPQISIGPWLIFSFLQVLKMSSQK